MHLHNAESTPEFDELHLPQRLGEDVGELSSSPNMIYFHPSILNALVDKMILSINVLTAVMVHWIPAECNSGHIVHE